MITTSLSSLQVFFSFYLRTEHNNFIFLDDLSLRQKAVISGFAGFLGCLVSTPFEVVMVRQIAEGALPSHLKRNIQSMGDGLAKAQPLEYFKGFLPTAVKMIVLNASNKLILIFY